ncbi:helix-turn-helix domain-containing protein [Planomicrobium sp. YIM 101495]|uniref:helix-turn-helix domain-containing protein n=1 Tax=Planomicrobium sp. YIM 101495 TaxID=2665160 RepID=UPI0012B7CEFB|nr:helix-turn-helix domain-containing protein [Planomicrobium sp. YIM 101495]MTD30084.1 hypothetical protein [Planomicrobium sp. YIM 101495]
MLFSELILGIMKSIDGQRTVSSPYHLLKGKKSGQTIQDVGYFNLHAYFALFPKLDKALYDQEIAALENDGFLVKGTDMIQLTDKSRTVFSMQSCLDGWKYRGKETLFFKRLSLIVQTFSHATHKIRRFDPVQTEEDVQRWVKRYLSMISFREAGVAESFKQELFASMIAVQLPDAGKQVVMNRLSGFQVSGLTWLQIATSTGLKPLDVQLSGVETLHGWMREIERGNYPLLLPLLENITQQSAMTESAVHTKRLFEQGLSLEEIAVRRTLKTSTIEDHFVEMAINDPSFDFRPFIPVPLYEQIISTSKLTQSKRLRDIKEHLPEAGYFQIRLALATQGGAK